MEIMCSQPVKYACKDGDPLTDGQSSASGRASCRSIITAGNLSTIRLNAFRNGRLRCGSTGRMSFLWSHDTDGTASHLAAPFFVVSAFF